MSKEFPPFVNATGQLSNLFTKIKDAPPPPRFTQDFLTTKLGFTKSGSSLAFIPFLKKIGFLGSDGIPTDIYKKFRNPDTKVSSVAMANAMKIGYTELFSRNEYWPKLSKDELKNLLVEITEVEPKNGTIPSVINSIQVLKDLANFDISESDSSVIPPEGKTNQTKEIGQTNEGFSKLNLSYTINLNLPETSDITVFDAIFKSLKENILNNE